MHDFNLAAYYCDKVILMKDGKIFAVGAPSEVLTPSNVEAVSKAVEMGKRVYLVETKAGLSAVNDRDYTGRGHKVAERHIQEGRQGGLR
jgi:ABC-type hemin transport system ATPase subunit